MNVTIMQAVRWPSHPQSMKLMLGHLLTVVVDNPILVETSILGRNWGLTDVWLPSWDDGAVLDLIIMIDGVGHLNKQTFSTSPRQQQDIDRRFLRQMLAARAIAESEGGFASSRPA